MKIWNSQLLVKFKTGLLKEGGKTIDKGLSEIVEHSLYFPVQVRALLRNFVTGWDTLSVIPCTSVLSLIYNTQSNK
jgi:hypothetical protein